MTRAYRASRGLVRILVAAFFRRLETAGASSVPATGGAILVAWHPNGLVDPALIIARCPRPVVFGARHGLFRWPGLGRLMRALGTVALYRASDVAGREARAANRQTIDGLAQAVAAGSLTALFPEGQSHDAPHPTRLRTGTARLYYLARQHQASDQPPPAIVPVALHYDRKEMYRSDALVVFHPPLALPAALDVRPPDDEPEEESRARCQALTDEIEHVLNDVVHATKDWELHQHLHRARSIVQAERAREAGGRPSTALSDRTRMFQAVRDGYYRRIQTHPKQVARLRRRIRSYDADLRALGLEDADLDGSPRFTRPWLVAILALQLAGFVLLIPSILVLGYLVNLPAALTLRWITERTAKLAKDEATVKVLLGALVMPLTWIGVGVLAAWGHHALYERYPGIPDVPVLAGVTFGVLAAVGGIVGLRFRRVLREMSRSLAVRLTRTRQREAIERLRAEREWIYRALLSLA